ncbi:MAG: hypothetical protein KJO33_00205 [Gammaproteobacteria bacterium]|nr:hypothetical protein [Gammaproteobacteria bacterium]
MNWDAIAAVGEMLGALAVLVTLLYLAVQIKQNTSAVATATYESTMTGFNDINVVVAGNPALSSLIDRGCQNADSLNAEEAVQFNFLLRCYANQWWKLFKLYERGSLPGHEWRIFAREAAQFLDQPGCKPFCAQNALFADLYTELDKHRGGVISDFGFVSETSEGRIT